MVKEKSLKSAVLKNRLIILSTVILVTLSADAKDFGIKGHTHQINEQPFLKMLNDRLKEVDMEKEKEKMEKITKERIHNPLAIESIKPAVKNHTFYYDPTYVLEEDAVLPCGKILHNAGTTVNPLEYMDLNRRLFFIDSRKKEQVKWLKAELSNPLQDQKELVEDRVILVGGKPLELEKELEVPIYFDQQGALTNKFGIKHSPAIVVQEGLKIRINEIKLINQ